MSEPLSIRERTIMSIVFLSLCAAFWLYDFLALSANYNRIGSTVLLVLGTSLLCFLAGRY